MNKRYAVFFIAPLVIFFLTVKIIENRGSFYSRHYLDPDYSYLLNSLSLAKGHRPWHSDHPGTPNQVLGAAVLRLTQGKPLVESVLRNPEGALRRIAIAIALLNAAALCALGLILAFLDYPLFSIPLIQLSTLLYPPTLHGLGRAYPESFLLFPAALLLGCLALHFKKPREAGGGRHAVAQGAIIGFGAAIKLLFFPLLLTAFFFGKWKDRFSCVTAAIASFLAATFPVWPHFASRMRWFGEIARGEALDHSDPFFSVVRIFLAAEPSLLAALVSTAALSIAFSFNRRGEPRSKTPLLSFAVLALFLALNTKRPNMNYFIEPMVVVVPLLGVWAANRIKSGLFWAAALAAASLCVIPKAPPFLSELRSSAAEQTAMVARHADRRCTLIGSYTSSFMDYALAYGNSYAGELFSPDLRRLYPRSVAYLENGHPGFSSFGKELSNGELQERLRKGECFLLFTENDRLKNDRSIMTAPLERAGERGFYQIRDFLASKNGSVKGSAVPPSRR